MRSETEARRLGPTGPRSWLLQPSCARATSSCARPGDVIPSDGEIIEGIASVDESAITGESAPVIRESGGDRSAVTGGTKVLSDRIVVAHHRRAGSHLPRPDDHPRRGCQPAEDPERDRAHDPARRAHDRLPPGRRGPRSRSALLRGHGLGRHPRRTARLPHPDHDRRAAVRHRYRRDGPPRPAQRARHERPGRRGGRRRPDAAARQDRHDHPRQPDGVRLLPGGGHTEEERGRRRPAGVARRRDPRGPLHRRARQGALRDPRAGADRRAHVRALHGDDPHVRVSTSDGRQIRKGAAEAVQRWVTEQGGVVPAGLEDSVNEIARHGSTPLVVADGPDHPRRDRAEGRGEGRYPGALRRDARERGSGP